jgi:hypothetical protein
LLLHLVRAYDCARPSAGGVDRGVRCRLLSCLLACAFPTNAAQVRQLLQGAIRVCA